MTQALAFCVGLGDDYRRRRSACRWAALEACEWAENLLGSHHFLKR